MNFRKTIAGISALILTTGSLAAVPVTAFADNNDTGTTDQAFTEGRIITHVYDAGDLTETQCRFYSQTPNIPYVSLSEFYRTINQGEELTIIKNEKGSYDINNILGAGCEIDTNKDVFTTSDYYPNVCFPIEEISADSSMNNTFVIPSEGEEKGEPHDMVIDFADYDIDLYGEDSDIWFPLPTLCNMFSGMQHRGIYFDKELYYTIDINFSSLEDVFTAEGMENIIKDFENGRPEDLAAYNYNEICRVFDCDYGFPGSIPLTDAIREKGLDGALSETNNDTRGVKEKLLSTDFFTYMTGLTELEFYTYDGGHTVMADTALGYMTKEQVNDVLSGLKEDVNYELCADIAGIEGYQSSSYTGAFNEKNAVFGKNEGQFFRYIVKGDTALFSFDSFSSVDLAGWIAYYEGEGERPVDVISAFYECVKDADENPDVRNFIVDVSTNGGGLDMTDIYMISLMGGDPVCYNEYLDKGTTVVQKYIIDKNLDGKLDEKDEELKFDLNFGVIESGASFSCANEFPSDAKDAGIMVIGEKSSGGSCCINGYTTPDGMPFYMSYRIKMTNKDGYDIDHGIQPDYELVTVNEDGSKDFSKVFDFDVISECFADFYGTKTEDTTAPEITTGTTAAVVTTAADTYTTTVADEEITTTSAVSETKTTESTTVSSTGTAAETAAGKTEENSFFAPVNEMGDMAIADYESKNGTAPAKAVTKDNLDGTYSIILSDEKGNVLDAYVIDPDTGKGKDSKGNDVDLPQTGINSMGHMLIVIAAFFMIGSGVIAVTVSGAGKRRKED